MKRPWTDVELVEDAAVASNGPATCPSDQVRPRFDELENQTSVVSCLSPGLSRRKSSHRTPMTPCESTATLGMNACAATDRTTVGAEKLTPLSVDRAILIRVRSIDWMSLNTTYSVPSGAVAADTSGNARTSVFV